eukprot:IDg12925t1
MSLFEEAEPPSGVLRAATALEKLILAVAAHFCAIDSSRPRSRLVPEGLD